MSESRPAVRGVSAADDVIVMEAPLRMPPHAEPDERAGRRDVADWLHFLGRLAALDPA